MAYDPDKHSEPPDFYATYVQQILDIIIENARQEFRAIWTCNQKDGVPKVEATRKLSIKINKMCDNMEKQFKSGMTEQEKQQLVRAVLLKAVPPLMIQHLGVDGILARVPENYIGSIVGAWVASRFVYRYGINASEVSFFFFMRSLLSIGGDGSCEEAPVAGTPTAKRPAGAVVGSVAEEGPPAQRPKLG